MYCSCIVFHKTFVSDVSPQYVQCVAYAVIFYCLEWLDTLEFYPLLCPNDKINNAVVFADRIRYPFIMFGNRVLIVLSRLLYAHIAYEVDTAKNIATCCRISYCLCDFIRLNSIGCRVQTKRWTMMLFSPIDSVIHWPCVGIVYW